MATGPLSVRVSAETLRTVTPADPAAAQSRYGPLGYSFDLYDPRARTLRVSFRARSSELIAALSLA